MARHEGGCQCGRVRYAVEVELDQLDHLQLLALRQAGLGAGLRARLGLHAEAGEDALTEYRFNTHKISHLFCEDCGIQSFGRGVGPDGSEMAAINVRCLDDVDVFALEPHRFDGKSR